MLKSSSIVLIGVLEASGHNDMTSLLRIALDKAVLFAEQGALAQHDRELYRCSEGVHRRS